jgi:inosose dehydratase
MLRFAYSTINWGTTCDLPTALAEIREAGWGAVELFGHSLDWLGPRETLTAALDGLAVATLCGSVALPITEEQRDTHRRQIAYAAEVGATAYGIVGGQRLRYRPPTDAEYAELSAFLEGLATYGAARGVAVSYHPHTGCTVETAGETETLLRGTSALRLCLDASHIALVDEDPLATFARFRDRIGYIHLKDWARGKFVELGQGTIGLDFPALLRALEARDFAGWVVIENSRSDVSPLASARANAAYLTGLGHAIDPRSDPRGRG